MNNEVYEDSIALVKKKKQNKRTKLIIIICIIAMVCAVIAFFIINHYYKTTKTISFDDYEVYQYFSGIKYNYTGRVTLGNDILTSIDDKGKKVSINETPIYYQSVDNECIIPITMGLFFVNEKGRNYRINYFSKLQLEISNDDEMAFIDYNKKKMYINDAFLYDGKDMYVFPYSATLVVEDKTYELSPLSYVIVNYKDSVEIYDKENDKYYFVDEIESDVIATMKGNKINLSTDMIVYGDEGRLLIKNINKLNQFEG